jgi:pimeloyl-ACP methyl ester carboxylesterase
MTAQCVLRTVRAGEYRWSIRELAAAHDTAPTVVLVPGLGSGEYLLPHAERLATSRRVLVPDMPGFGHTRGPRRLRAVAEFGSTLVELVRAEADGVVDLIGNSFGSQVVLAAAGQAPELVRRIVLIGPTFDSAARTYRQVLSRWLLIAPREPPALAVSLARSYLKCGVRTPLFALQAAMRDRPEDLVATLPHPILLVRGSNDRIAPRRWLEDLQQRAADARIAEVPDTAHTVDFAAPEAAARLTSSFFDAEK